VVLEAMIGNRFTPADVFDSPDILKLVTDKAGTFRQVDFRVNNKITRVNCKEAGAILKNYLQPEYERISQKYIGTDFALAGGNSGLGLGNIGGGINQILKRNLEVGYANSLGVNESASNIMKQNMMINALKDYTNISDKYGYTRADDLQKSNWKISGELAKEYLPIFLNILKALVYSSFIFIVPLMILSGGASQYLKYCAVVFSLQIWPALNAVLNLFIELYSKVRAAGITGGSLTFTNFNGIHESIDTIVLVASGLQMSIPFLSFAIVQGGVGSFVHLASSIQGASAGAASVASGEVTTGNRSFDNISQNTASIGNKSGFKTDFNQLHQEGATQVQRADGSMIKTFADGNSSISSGAGQNLSSGSRRFTTSRGEQTAAHENMSNLLSSAKSDDQSYTKSTASQMRSASNLVASLAQRESAGETFDYKELGEKGQNLQQMVNSAKDIHDRDGYGYEQSAHAAVRPYVDGGGKIPDFVPFVKGEAGIRVDGAVEAGNKSNQSLDREESVHRGNDTSTSFTNQEAASKNKQWMKDNNIDTSFAEETQGSYEEAQSYQQSASQKIEEAETWSKTAEYAKSRSATDDQDEYHNVEKATMKQYGVSQEDAHQMIETGDRRVDTVWQGISQSKASQLKEQIQSGRISIENSASQDATSFHNEHYGKVNRDGLESVKTQASDAGLNKEKMESKVATSGLELQDKHKDITTENNVQYKSVKHANELLESGLNKRANKHEEDRIGQGVTSKVIGTLAQIPTVGNGGNLNVGGLNKAERAMQNLQGDIKPLKSTSIKKQGD
ncbi:MAG: conjugal transfer protein TraG N-terminal domain-containing protein, partial [Rickettsiaceae bacterium]|nr:conjugal transfer protein TraG N-terminal domain-containing protein [Rickettsiaceae bacterium]